MNEFETPEKTGQPSEQSPRMADVAQFAQESYQIETGIRQAVDDGIITMKELEIYHYLTAWTNENAPYLFDNPRENERSYRQTLERAYRVVATLYSISEDEARRIFEKVRNIPKVLPDEIR